MNFSRALLTGALAVTVATAATGALAQAGDFPNKPLDSEHIAALPHLYKSKNFVTLQHFDPVASLFRTPFFVAVGTDSKWKNMGDLIAAAKADPDAIVYGSWGVGSPGHLGAQQLEALSGIRMRHAPYREVSQLYSNVGTGEVPWAFASIPSSQ
eukprot:gene54318-72584_t